MVKQGEAGLFSIVYIYYIYAFVSLFYTINSMSDVVASTSTSWQFVASYLCQPRVCKYSIPVFSFSRQLILVVAEEDA